ncbi:MAG: hypothetical protein LBE35_03635 [Clostridiales bacterium]|jgi:hypothetical protein|nr:hypothetical protein [Clostridiales bacterium]
MDFVTTMLLTGTLEDKEERHGMTDIQFKAMVKMCLTIAENTKDIKEFKKLLVFPDQGYGAAFVAMLSRMADTIVSMEKVRGVLRDIMMMEGEN